MEDNSTLSNLSALLDDDESVGHRLAEYLIKKKGTKVTHRVFADFVPDRFSIDVRTERVKSPENKDVVEQQPEISEDAVTEAAIESSKPEAPQKSPFVLPSPPSTKLSATRRSGGMPTADRLRRYSLKRLSCAGGRRTLLKEFDNTVSDSTFMPPICSTPMVIKSDNLNSPNTHETQRNKTLVSNVGENTNSSAVRLSQIDSGNSNDILNNLCVHEKNLQHMLKNAVESTLVKIHEKENQERCYDVSSPQQRNRCTLSPNHTTESTMRQRTYTVEKGLKPGQVVLTPTKSPVVQKSNVESITPQKMNITSSINSLSKIVPSTSTHPKQLLASPKQMSALQRIIGLSCLQNSTIKTSLNRDEIENTPEKMNSNQPNKSLPCHVVIPETQQPQDDVIAETENLSVNTQQLLNSLQKSQSQSPIIVIPVHQTFNSVPSTQPEDASKISTNHNEVVNEVMNSTMDELKSTFNDKTTRRTRNTSTASPKVLVSRDNGLRPNIISNLPNEIPNVDDLRIADILTDEEDGVVAASISAKKINLNCTNKNRLSPKSPALEMDNNKLCLTDVLSDEVDTYVSHTNNSNIQMECSSAPLNLAPPIDNRKSSTRTRRLRRRSTTRTQMNKSQVLSTETENEVGTPRPQALVTRRLSSRQRQHRRNIPLNAEPSMPINGEKFAAELKSHLARLNNYEILDLRKRNSMGKVFPVIARKSISKKEALDKQLQLEEEIQMEILKRNMEANGEDLRQLERMQIDQDTDTFLHEIPPAPDGFRDLERIEQEGSERLSNQTAVTLKETYNSSLVDDNSCDRVSFIPPRNERPKVRNSERRRSRRANKTMPEIMQKYLEVPKQLKKSLSNGNNTKRCLYSHLSEDTENTSGGQIKQSSENVVSSVVAPELSPSTPSPTRESSSITEEMHLRVETPSPTRPVDDDLIIPSTSLADTSNSNEMQIFKKPKIPSKKKTGKPKTDKINLRVKTPSPTRPVDNDLITPSTSVADTSDSNEMQIFKKPKIPSKKKTGKSKTSTKERDADSTTVAREENNNSVDPPIDNASGVRRSKRGHMPLRNYWSFTSTDPTPLYDIGLHYRKIEEAKQKRILKKNGTFNSTSETISDNYLLPSASSTVVKRGTVQNSGNRRKAKKGILGDTSSISDASSTVKAPRKKRLIAIPEAIQEEHPHSNNMYEELDEVNISATRTHMISRTNEKHIETKVPKVKSSNKKKNIENSKQPPEKKKKNNITEEGVAEIAPETWQEDDMFHIHNFMDQIKNATMNETASQANNPNKEKQKRTKGKKLRVRLQRVQPISINVRSSSSTTTKNQNSKRTSDTVTAPVANKSLNQAESPLSWFRNLSNNASSSSAVTQQQKIFEEMDFSSPGNLVFSHLDGIDYAYYENDTNVPFSFIRFKPQQIKPTKRARQFHLQFFVLSGKFKICTNKDEGLFDNGAVVTIHIGARYSIKNVADCVGILMVFKRSSNESVEIVK